jgi:hypothetical protein
VPRSAKLALTPGQPDPIAVRRWERYAAPLIRLAFRPTLDGIEHLPRDRPVMIVANHSGLGLAEIANADLFASDDMTVAYERVRTAVEAEVRAGVQSRRASTTVRS